MLTSALNNQYGRLPESITNTDTNERIESSTTQTTSRNYLQRTIQLINDGTSSTTRLVCTTLAIGTLVIGGVVGFSAASYFTGRALLGCIDGTEKDCDSPKIVFGIAGGMTLGLGLIVIGSIAAGAISLCSATHNYIEDRLQEFREQRMLNRMHLES